MKKKEKKERFFRRLFKLPLIIFTIIVIIAAILFGVYGYIYSGKNVYAYVKGEPIYYYEMSNEIVEQARKNFVSVSLLQGGDPQSAFARYAIDSFAKEEVISRKFFYLMGVQDNFNCTESELDTAMYEFKKAVTGISDDPVENLASELALRQITEQQLRNVLRGKIIAQKEIDKLTQHIVLTPDEIYAYYEEWSFAYEEEGKTSEEIFKEKYDIIERSALSLKK
ncbi:MAG: hypothetical protein U9Q18_00835, partial [Caldisericota bacterium]|nr:hypothetical protein [Caldisericota bacterium]